ncbi:MAG: DegT/DnrJ/EryC1/StrS family aminotransferase, partial [Bacteroidia bacterium]
KIGESFAGNLGDFGCHSFYSTKIMTTGEGGMITTNDENAFYQCSSIRSIGIDTKSSVEIFTNIGSNNRLPEFESILGIYQLKRVEEFVTHRIKIANVYKEELNMLKEKGLIRFQETPENIRHPYWKFIIFIKKEEVSRNNIKEKLIKFGINIDSPYNPLMHLQPIYKNLFRTKSGDFFKSEKLSQTHFCLPIHFQISVEDAKNISQILISAILHD